MLYAVSDWSRSYFKFFFCAEEFVCAAVSGVSKNGVHVILF